MTQPVIDVSAYARRALEQIVGKPLDDDEDRLTPFEANVLRKLAFQIERAILFERQGVAQIVLTAIEQVKTKKISSERDQFTVVEVLEDVKERIDLRSAATPEMVDRLANLLRKSFENTPENGGLIGLNKIGETTYASFAEASRAIILGQAPCSLEDDTRVWSSLVDAKVFRWA